MSTGRRFVYIIKSLVEPDEYYVGVTSDVGLRLRAHNEGLSPHTSRWRPWRALVVIEFEDVEPALKFERYLKSGSGRELPADTSGRRCDPGSATQPAERPDASWRQRCDPGARV
jgi:predicted GIY-YIG superfamily endonuclease